MDELRRLALAAASGAVGLALLVALALLLPLRALPAGRGRTPYERVVTAVLGVLEAARRRAVPPVPGSDAGLRGRDVAWLASPLGLLGALVLVDCFAAGVLGLIMPLVYAASGDHRVDYQWVVVDDASLAFFAVPVGLVFCVLAVLALGPAVRLEDRRTWRLLAPSAAARLTERVQTLTATRSQAIDASAVELRRIERDLHDGAQVQLVSVAMHLGMADDLIDRDPGAARAMLERAREGADEAMADLRALVRGIVPPLLADRGLAGAVEALAAGSALRVDLHVDVPGRLPAPLESATYFAAVELLTNAVRHSGATRVAMELALASGVLVLRVVDDGRGGARVDGGTGLRGLERRLAPFDGTLELASPPGGPTRAEVRVPCASS